MPQRYKTVSIITLNWNGRRWLDRCLSSLLAQTYPHTEVIMVDNHSSDDSVAFVHQKFPQVKVVANSDNLGFAGGNNSGIAPAQGELILLINNDTWVKPDFVANLVRHYEERGVDVLAPYSTDYDHPAYQRYSTTMDVLGHPVRYEDVVPGQPTKCLYLSGVAMLVAKDTYLQTQGLDDSFFMYFEEADWFWRLRLLGKTFAFDPDSFVFHAGAGSTGGNGGIKLKLFLWRNQNNPQMLLKNYAWYNLLWVIPLYLLQNLCEVVAFLVLLRPQVAWTYVQGWSYVLRHLAEIWRKRQWVQRHRVVGDTAILRQMYWGPGKLRHLLHHLQRRSRHD